MTKYFIVSYSFGAYISTGICLNFNSYKLTYSTEKIFKDEAQIYGLRLYIKDKRICKCMNT